MPGFINSRGLTGRPYKEAGEKVRQARVTLPIQDEAFEKVWPAQKWAIHWRRAAHYNVVSTTRTGVAAINHEFFSAQSCLPGFLIDFLSGLHAFAPVGSRMDIDFDNARVGCHTDDIEAWITGRGVAFNVNRKTNFSCCFLCCIHKFQIVLKGFNRRHEDT